MSTTESTDQPPTASEAAARAVAIFALLNEHEAATFLRINVKTLQAWRTAKAGPRFAKLGRRIVYPARELEHFVARSLVETRPLRGQS